MKAAELHAGVWVALAGRRSRLPHALLLAGPAGSCKMALALEFAALLLCENPSEESPCGRCPGCIWYRLGNHPDFRLLRPAVLADQDAAGGPLAVGESVEAKASREITVDQIRDLAGFLAVGTHRAGYRVVVISPAESMNRNTANALLKSLEEPGPGTLFMLVSDHPSELLPTLRSRCQQIVVPRPGLALARRWLVEAGVKDTDRWLNRAGGSPRRAIELATGPEGELLGMLEREFGRGQAFRSIMASAELDKLLKANRAIGADAVVAWVQCWLADLSLAKHGLKPRYFPEQGTVLGEIADSVPQASLRALWKQAIELKKVSQHTLNNRLFFDSLLFCYADAISSGNP